jgi:catechol 2,3-dioxygenase-like lactoylglutathione lyase family enzyme
MMMSVNEEGKAGASSIRGLGEIALRVQDLDTMQQFYEQVIGLAVLRRFPNCVFFKIADGFGGHTQVLALFDRSEDSGYAGVDAAKSTIDHIAFEISAEDFRREKTRLEALGVEVVTTTHAWVHWRSLYVHDPEGNEVELVCYDGNVE